MKISRLRFFFRLCLVMAVSPSVMAASIANGSFVNGLTNWSTFYTDAGNVTTSAGQAVLSTGDSSLAAIPAALGQGVVYDNFGDPILSNPFNLTKNDLTLNFTAVFQNVGSNPNENGSGPGNDLLNVVAYDASNAYILTTLSATTTQTSFALDLSSLWNHSVGFSFELNNNNDGFASQVTLSNISITDASASAVPEAEEWIMMILGLPLISWVVRRRKQFLTVAI